LVFIDAAAPAERWRQLKKRPAAGITGMHTWSPQHKTVSAFVHWRRLLPAPGIVQTNVTAACTPDADEAAHENAQSYRQLSKQQPK
jgi:hypothetical protein